MSHRPKPTSDARNDWTLTPLALIAELTPRPRLHHHRYFGVLAPNAPLRAAVTALTPADESQADTEQATNLQNDVPEDAHAPQEPRP